MKHALMSIKPDFVDSIIEGRKTVEIRRRRPSLAPGHWLWIYSTMPRGRIEVVATIRSVTPGPPLDIWRQFGEMTGISSDEYQDYVNGSSCAVAISLTNVRKLSTSISLAKLRETACGFQPPQFFRWLEDDSPIASSCLEFL